MRQFLLGVFFVITVISLSCCRNNSDNYKSSAVIDSLKEELDHLSSTDYAKAESLVKKGMKLSKDSNDYYYFMSVMSSIKMWNADYKDMDSLQHLIFKYAEKAKPSPELNSLLAQYYNIEGNKYILKYKPDSSLIYYKKALAYQKNGNKQTNQAGILTNMSDAYYQMSDYAHAALCLRQVLFMSDTLGGKKDMQIQSALGLSKIYLGLRNFKESGRYFKIAEKLQPYMEGRQKNIFHITMGNYYYFKEDYPKALNEFKIAAKALDDSPQMVFDKNLININTSDVYIKLGYIDSATVYLNKCYDFFNKTNNEAALYYWRTQQIAIALKKNDLSLVKELINKKDVQTSESEQLYIRNKYLLDYYKRIGDDHNVLTYYMKIRHVDDSIRGEREKLATAETEMRYKQSSKELKLQLNLAKSRGDLRTSNFIIIISMLVIIILIALIVISIIINRNRRNKALMREKNRITKLQMEELRNRVSPHFIFNVLNYELYSRQNGEETNDIPMLVKLIRHGLEVSESLCVPLSKELEFIENYVTLQSKGIGDNFEFRKNVSPDIDTNKVLIPSMMIQIAVENAIKHGLRGLKNDKILEIKINSIKNATQVLVLDNGRGLKASNADSKGTGTGMRVIHETLEILNNRNREKLQYYMKENPHGIGCCVEITIPNEYNYSLE